MLPPGYVAALRARLGYTQHDLARRLNVTATTVSYWETGRSHPSIKRRHMLESLEADIAAPPVPALGPFRPIQYLGSKKNLAPVISDVIAALRGNEERVCDLFAGSGVVSQELARTGPVTAVDVQAYSSGLVNALLKSKPEDYAVLESNAFWSRVEHFHSNLVVLFKELMEYEEQALTEIGQGGASKIQDLIEFGSVAAYVQRQNRDRPNHLAVKMDATLRRLRNQTIPSRWTLTTRYFGGSYFSYRQAAMLDSIAMAAEALDPPQARAAQSVMLSTASDIVGTVGKQFAQPMRIVKADGRVQRLLCDRLAKDRARDVKSVYLRWLEKWRCKPDVTRYKHSALHGDVLDISEQDLECDVYYADPPYTIDHYSRFYHVLETMTLRDDPSLSEMRKAGRTSIMRGLYREERHQSLFSIPSKAPDAFRRLFANVASRKASFVVSYSPYDVTEGNRARVVTLDFLAQLARESYEVVDIVSVGEHSHRKLNQAELNFSTRVDAERLIICKNARF